MQNRMQNSTVTTPKSAVSACGKAIRPRLGQNLTAVGPLRIDSPNTPNTYVRPVAVVTPEKSRTKMRAQHPDIEHLNEQIKQAKIKQLQSQRQSQATMEKQRLAQNNAQRQQHSNASQQQQQSVQTPLNNPARRLATLNSAQQRTQQVGRTSQGSQIQKLPVTSTSSSTEHGMRVNATADVSPSDCAQEKRHVTRQSQSSSPRSSETESNSSESIAYLQQTISDPKTAIVQDQIKTNTAKMLVMLASGEQRLITFDLPSDDCSVHDLLEQVREAVKQFRELLRYNLRIANSWLATCWRGQLETRERFLEDLLFKARVTFVLVEHYVRL